MKKKLIPVLMLIACIGGYGAVQFLFPLFNNAPVYQEITVADSTFEHKFYFEQLSEEDQLVYKELYQGVDAHAEEITVHCLDGEKAGTILHSVVFDFPEIFWTDGSSNTLTFEGSHVIVKPTYAYSKEEREIMQAEIDAQVDAILSRVTTEKGEYETIKSVYEILVHDVTYVENAPDNQNIYSTFVRKETVCAGYAKANQYLLERLGIYCIYVMGEAEGENHAWNIVQCNGVLCHVDVTWADPMFSEDIQEIPEGILYDYLCCNDAMMEKTHRKDENYAYPECTSVEWEYYHVNQAYYESADRQLLLNAMYESIRAKESCTIFKFADQNLYTQGRELLVNELIEKAGEYLCNRYGLRQIQCIYREYASLNRIVIDWSYE